jgi:cAMP-dependent protein kinase regulator
MSYDKGEYFGELALLDSEKGTRKATVKAETDLILMSIDKEGFTRILGPIEDILKRNMSKYQKFVKS